MADRKRSLNDKRRRTMKELVKSVKTEASKDAKAAKAELSKAYQAIDKALKRGVIKKNTAARKKSRLSAAVKKAAK